ncbi:hypothetical protein GI584_14220 [Gracilibacillus salitolerans]|uniref:Tail spike domain-containing protein n=1 Tax=Gracilibacillus salitolerans TaxID=2663022 RepID=A0A5Q2TQB0_9BACI|nr:phage tail spike protein [Gracilibacillus salitolerans]QGH35128.1 hypothetical protein GI584_14220 [Gracilibacillus salitolerans]
MIHITDKQNDGVLGFISEKNFTDNLHKQSLQDYLSTFNFLTFADKKYSEHLTKLNRVIIPAEDQGYHEFIIDQVEKYRDRTGLKSEVQTLGSYLLLKKAKVIKPQTLEEYSASMAVGFATNGTEWRPGIIESDGVRTFKIESHTNPFSLLKRIANEFGLELRFRVETDGNKVTGRYVDLLDRVGVWRGREITFGKDLESIRRIEKGEIFTALIGLGPEDENGNRLEVLVEDEDALQRWGRPDPLTGELKHLIGTYEPQSERSDMTEEELRQYTRTELDKRISAVIEWVANIIDLEHVPGVENKKIRFGDTIKIKDEKFNPPLYVEARVHEQERDIKKRSRKRVKLGDFEEFTEEEVNAVWQRLQAIIQEKISMSEFEELTYTKPEIDEKDKPGNDAADKIETDVGWTEVIETEQGSQSKADQAEENANNHTDQIKQDIDQELLDKAGLEYVDGQLVLKADSETVQTINNTVSDLETTTDNLLIDVANNAQGLSDQDGRVTTVETDLDTVEGQLSLAVTDLELLENEVSTQGTQISANSEAISLKAEASVVEVLQDEFDALTIGARNIISGTSDEFEIYNATSSWADYRPYGSVEGMPGQVYTARVYLKSDPNNIKDVGMRIRTQDDDGTWASSTDFNGNWIKPGEEGYSTVTFTMPENRTKIVPFIIRFASNELVESYVEYKEAKLEKGSKPSDWTRSPEDVASDISAVESSVTDISADLEIMAGQIEAKAEKSSLENLEGDVSNLSSDVGQLTVAYDGISANVSSLQSTTDGHTSDISNLSSQLDIQADQISSKVSQTELNNIQTGFRNICPTNFGDWESGHYSTTDGEKQAQGPRLRLKDLLRVSPGESYYFKIFRSGEAELNGLRFVIRGYDVDRNFIGTKSTTADASMTMTMSEGDLYYISVALWDGPSPDSYDWYRQQFEQGNIKPLICLDSYGDRTFEEHYSNIASSRIDNSESSIIQLSNQIESKVSETTYNSDMASINEDISQRAMEYSVDMPMTSSEDYVILLCRFDLTGQENFAMGTLSGRRTSGHYSVGEVKVIFNNDTNGTSPSGYFEAIDVQYTNSWSMVTCVYDGREYVALRHKPGNQFGLWNNNPKFYGQIGSSTSSTMLIAMHTSSVSNVSTFNSTGNVSSPILRAESSITQLSNQIEMKVEENDVRSIFTQEADSFTFEASQINFDGHVFGEDATFIGEISGARFYSGDNFRWIEIEGSKLTSVGTFHDEIYGTTDGVVTLESGRFTIDSTSDSTQSIVSASSRGLIVSYDDELYGYEGVLYSRSGMFFSVNETPVSISDDLPHVRRYPGGSININSVDSRVDWPLRLESAGNIRMVSDGDVEFRVSSVYDSLVLRRTDVSDEWKVGLPNSDYTIAYGDIETQSNRRLIIHQEENAVDIGYDKSGYLRSGYIDFSQSGNTSGYLGVTTRLRVTDGDFWTGSSTTHYQPINASSFNESSLEEMKQDIERMEMSALGIIKETDLYSYRLKNEVARGIDNTKYGVVIGVGYNTPHEILDDEAEAVSQYSMNTFSWRAIQELSEVRDDHEHRIDMLEMEVFHLREENDQLINRLNKLEEAV